MTTDDALERARQVKARYEADLLKKANVVAVGVGFRQRGGSPTREVCITVSVSKKQSLDELDPREVVPAEIEGVPVDVQETGEIRAL